MSSVAGLANTLAVITTILGAPPPHHYGYGFEGVTSLAWGGVSALLVFFASRMSISTVVPMLIMSLAARFL